MKRKILKRITLIALVFLCVLTATALALPALQARASYYGYPTFSITGVVHDQTVTIQTSNLPANDRFEVRMGLYGSLGWGTYIKTVDSGGGGAVKLEFSVPSGLKGLDRIAIRMDSPTTGYYAYNWFWNNTYPGAPATPKPTSPPSATKSPQPTAINYWDYPYFYIASVTRNGEVSLNAYNFPPNDTFEVTMNLYGTLGYGGYKAGTATTDSKGKLSSVTFKVPSQLDNLDRIAIRLQSPHSGFYAYNWFWNFDY